MLDEFHYKIDKKFIAQTPLQDREKARLLVLDGDKIRHKIFEDILSELKESTLVILNDSKVLPAKFDGVKISQDAGKVKVMLTREISKNIWECVVEGRHLKEGIVIRFESGKFTGKLVKWIKEGIYHLQIETDKPIRELMQKYGYVPLPHYIQTRPPDINRYQTVYASKEGSIAAPTAGLHFTTELMKKLQDNGIFFEYITLHVGLGSILPLRQGDLSKQHGYPEYFEISEGTAKRINEWKGKKQDILVVGTTCLKALESAAVNDGKINPKKGMSDLFIHPTYEFKFKFDKFLTNFHLPKAPPFVLTASLAGIAKLKKAYEEAKRKQYRFYSFGDAMLILF